MVSSVEGDRMAAVLMGQLVNRAGEGTARDGGSRGAAEGGDVGLDGVDAVSSAGCCENSSEYKSCSFSVNSPPVSSASGKLSPFIVSSMCISKLSGSVCTFLTYCMLRRL